MKITEETFEKLKALIKQYEKANSTDDRKKARQKMQKLGFRMTDFGITYVTLNDFEKLVESRRITVVGTSNEQLLGKQVVQLPIVVNSKDALSGNDVLEAQYNVISQTYIAKLDFSGLYSLRLKSGAGLPSAFQCICDERDHQTIYFGKAQGQTLSGRLQQELYAKGHGTFFRSIGAVLGYLPEAGSLIEKKNQNNYKFAQTDKLKIIDWIEQNLEIAVFPIQDDFTIEAAIISELKPLLNDSHNPLSLKELRQLKDQCRITARNQP